MNPANIKIVFIAAICFVLWGGYNVAKSSYVAITWTKAEGTVVDFEKNVWSCGKGIGECYNLIVGYHDSHKNYYTVNSKKNFNYDPPKHLMDQKIDVYYRPSKPAESVLGSGYGPMQYGTIMFLLGCVILFIFWVVKKKSS